jgi:hypothetical protein
MCYFGMTKQFEMKVTITVILLFFMLISEAQKPVFRISMMGIGDNREFDNGLSKSQTILGTLTAFEIGTSIAGNSIFAGISELYEFGSRIDFHLPHPIIYYKYEDQKKVFLFGSFPRLGEIEFPLAMLADTLLYFRPQIQGLLGKLTGTWGHQLAFVDWTGRQTATVRESFMAGSSGEVKMNQFFFQNYVLLNHLAHTSEKVNDLHIRDYFGYALLPGIRLRNDKQFSCQLKGGLLTSIFRERSVTDGFLVRNSFLFEGTCRYKNFTLLNTLHSGQKLEFALGDPLYRSANYFRTDVIWYFINFKNVKARFNWSFHLIDWNGLDNSQQLLLIYKL